SAAQEAPSEGLGTAARSGGLPPLTRVASTVLTSRVLSISTLMPVASWNGATTAWKLASSAPDQTPKKSRMPPIFVPPAAASATSLGSLSPANMVAGVGGTVVGTLGALV